MTGLAIDHIGSSSSSQFKPKTLTLNQLLHVPSISKNLLSLSKVSSDNNVYFDFYPNHCHVKDQVTHDVLMEGNLDVPYMSSLLPSSFVHQQQLLQTCLPQTMSLNQQAYSSNKLL